MPAWTLMVATAAVALLVTGLVVAAARSRARAERERTAAQAEAGRLRAQVEAIERRLDDAAHASAPAAPTDGDFVITRLGADDDAEAEPVPTVAAPLFADLVLREGVVQAASLAAGLRRALAPETRNRIRFEMRREVKRSRRQRRADLKEARRDWEARQRAATSLDEDSAA